MNEHRPTSWSADADDRWNTFRQLVLAGTDPDEAARQAGIEPLS